MAQVLRPSCHIQSLHFWDAVYLSETAPAVASGVSSEQFEAAGSDVSSSSAVTSPDQQVSCLPVKTRSCDDLTKAGLDDDDDIVPMMSAQRRLSDPNIAAHSAAADAAASAPTETNDEDEDDISCVRTSVNCEQTDDDVRHCDERRQSEASNSDSTSGASMTTVSLVAVNSQKCASNETLKAVEDETMTCDPAGRSLNDECFNNALKQTGCSEAGSPAVLAMFQASSDTLTGEDGHSLAVIAGECHTAPTSALADGESVNLTVNDDELSTNGLAVHSQVLKMKTMLDRCSSTSDISSSHVVDDSTVLMNGGGTRKAVMPLTVDTRLALAAATGSGTATKGVVNGDGDGPVTSQPASCSSTSPPTPNSDIRVCYAAQHFALLSIVLNI